MKAEDIPAIAPATKLYTNGRAKITLVSELRGIGCEGNGMRTFFLLSSHGLRSKKE
jgi:hypothetical protein